MAPRMLGSMTAPQAETHSSLETVMLVLSLHTQVLELSAKVSLKRKSTVLLKIQSQMLGLMTAPQIELWMENMAVEPKVHQVLMLKDLSIKSVLNAKVLLKRKQRAWPKLETHGQMLGLMTAIQREIHWL